jgi:hypothetical protein
MLVTHRRNCPGMIWLAFTYGSDIIPVLPG